MFNGIENKEQAKNLLQKLENLSSEERAREILQDIDLAVAKDLISRIEKLLSKE